MFSCASEATKGNNSVISTNYFIVINFRGLLEDAYYERLKVGDLASKSRFTGNACLTGLILNFHSHIQQNNNETKLSTCSFATKYSFLHVMHYTIQNLRCIFSIPNSCLCLK